MSESAKSKYIVQRERFEHSKKRYTTGDEIELLAGVAAQHLETGALIAAPAAKPATPAGGKGK